MNIECLRYGNTDIAVVTGGETVISDTESALNLAMRVKHEMGTDKIAIDKRTIAEGFFILSTGIAGEILQKFINYHVKAAIYGDYSNYTSKPLRDFIYESDRGSNFFFVATKEEAIEKLGEIQ